MRLLRELKSRTPAGKARFQRHRRGKQGLGAGAAALAGKGQRAAGPNAPCRLRELRPPRPPAPSAGRARARGSFPPGSAGSGTKPFRECHPGDESCTSAAARGAGAGGGGGYSVTRWGCGCRGGGGTIRSEMLKTFRATPRAQPVRRAGVRVG